MSDILRICFNQTLNGVGVCLVFFYRPVNVEDPLSSAEKLNTAFLESVVPKVNALQTVEVANVSLDTFNLLDPLDIDTMLVAGSGALGGVVDSNQAAIAFRSNRIRRDIRRGQKRVPGIPDINISDNDVAAPFDPAVNALAVQLGSTITTATIPQTPVYVPIVIKRIFVGIINNRRRYRLPETELELAYFDAVAWQWNRRISSQNSRKVVASFVTPP